MSGAARTPAEIVALLRPDDTLAVPLATGQPRSILRALGDRSDWRDLCLFTGLLTDAYPVLLHPSVRVISGFFGPVERMLRAGGARVEYLPRDFRGSRAFAEALRPRVVLAALSGPDEEGFCTFGLHAGATFDEFIAAARDSARLALAELNATMPRTHGLAEFGGHRIHVDEIDAYCTSQESVFELAEQAASDAEIAIANAVETEIGSGSTLQIGIGSVPDTVARLLASGPKGDFGIHSEMMVDGIRHLHAAGKVSDRKGVYDGFSVSTFAAGTRGLYDWLDDNPRVRFLPVQYVNDPAIVRRNRSMISINGALAIDLAGQVMADTRGGRQYSGVGGQEEFVIGARESPGGKSFFCLKSTAVSGGTRISTIVASLGSELVTTPRHHVQYVVTEYGIADLTMATDAQRARELTRIAHPDFRDELTNAAKAREG